MHDNDAAASTQAPSEYQDGISLDRPGSTGGMHGNDDHGVADAMHDDRSGEAGG
jgi:hypothetical protein